MIDKFCSYIDHTALKPTVSKEDIKRLCQEAKKWKFASVCINPCYVKYAKDLLKGSDVKICTVIGFPLGATTTQAKVAEAIYAYEDGCDEFDMVINIGHLKEMDKEYVKNDIEAVVNAVNGKTVKVIIETGLLTDEEKVLACSIASMAGAHFVKTCTGFAQGQALVSDILLMKDSIPKHVKIKASGGIRTYKDAEELINAGADRIGTSSGVTIMEDIK